MKNFKNTIITILVAGLIVFSISALLFLTTNDDEDDHLTQFIEANFEFVDDTILVTIYPHEPLSCEQVISFTTKEISIGKFSYILDSTSCDDTVSGIVTIKYKAATVL